MNKQTFIQLIKNPSGISPEQLLELEKVVAGFPYCQSAYILIAKQAAETGSMLADQKLKKASAYTLDRKNLKKILQGTSETPVLEIVNSFTEIPKEEKTLPEKPVTAKENPITLQEEISPIIMEKKNQEEKSSVKEALSDEQRDQIIKELQENLKRLHENKIKAAWEDVPKEIKIIGVNDQSEEMEESSIEKETIIVPADVSTINETEKNNEQETGFSSVVKEEITTDSNKKNVEENKEEVTIMNESQRFISAFIGFFIKSTHRCLSYPHRRCNSRNQRDGGGY